MLHGNYSMLLQNNDGQIEPSHSISAGLDYPGVGAGTRLSAQKRPGPLRHGQGRQRLGGFSATLPGRRHLPALESSHALAWVLDHPQEFAPGSHVVINLSGRGDKDMGIIRASLANNLPDKEEVHS